MFLLACTQPQPPPTTPPPTIPPRPPFFPGSLRSTMHRFAVAYQEDGGFDAEDLVLSGVDAREAARRAADPVQAIDIPAIGACRAVAGCWPRVWTGMPAAWVSAVALLDERMAEGQVHALSKKLGGEALCLHTCVLCGKAGSHAACGMDASAHSS
jgi:hypothetical protein